MIGLDVDAQASLDDLSFHMLSSPPRAGGGHRRARSDPSEIFHMLRSEQPHALPGNTGRGGSEAEQRDRSASETMGGMAAVALKRDLSPNPATGFSPVLKKQASANSPVFTFNCLFA